MSSERNTVEFFLDFELLNNFKINNKNARILKVLLHILHNPHYNFMRIISNRFTTHLKSNHNFVLFFFPVSTDKLYNVKFRKSTLSLASLALS
jgi:hypothetical protein